MASPILDVIEVYHGRGASFGADGTRRQTRKFHVKTVSGFTDSNVVLRAGNTGETEGGPRVPRMYEHYQAPDGSFDRTMIVEDIDAQPNKAHDLWVVTVRYTSRLDRGQLQSAGYGYAPGGGGAGDSPPEHQPLPGLDTDTVGGQPGASGEESQGAGAAIENPLLRPAKVRFYTVKFTEVLWKNRAGDNVGIMPTNSAGALFDPPLTYQSVRVGVSIARNQRKFKLSSFVQYVEKVNKNSWRGLQARQARLVDLDAEPNFENGFWFWAVQYKLEVKPDGWNPLKVVDRGTFYLDASNNEKRFTDRSGGPLTQGLLDNKGGKRPFGLKPLYIDVYPYEEIDFKGLGL